MSRPLRFGYVLSSLYEGGAVAAAQRAEALGFDVALASDHVGVRLAPLPMLAAVAAATEHIRLGTLVLNNDMRNPVQLAWDAATLDRLSDGRMELGLGAGHTPQEYAATGVDFEPPTTRKARLAESVEIIRRLLDGETVDYRGRYHNLDGAHIDGSHQEHLPILVGGNGAKLLGHAGAHADIIGFQGLGRTGPDGHTHAVKWDPDWLTTQIEQVRAGAGGRFEQLELNALVQRVEITEDRHGALQRLCEEIPGLVIEHAAAVPYVLIGTVDEIAEHVEACRRRWGITYYAVRELEAFAPVIAALR